MLLKPRQKLRKEKPVFQERLDIEDLGIKSDQLRLIPRRDRLVRRRNLFPCGSQVGIEVRLVEEQDAEVEKESDGQQYEGKKDESRKPALRFGMVAA